MHPGASATGEADAAELVLVDSIRRGDSSAWSRLLGGYQDRLYGVCFRMVGDREWAADLTQDAMVKIIQGLDSYDGRAKLSTWMIRVTMNVCLSGLRSEKHRRHASLDAMTERAAGRGGGGQGNGGGGGYQGTFADPRREPAADSGVLQREQREQLAAALLRVDADQRSMLVLRDVRGLEYEQIADVLGVPVGTVKSRLFRARTALREAMEKTDDPRATATTPRPTSPPTPRPDRPRTR